MSSPNSARKDSASQREFDRLKEQHSALGGTASGYSHDDDNSEQSAWPDLPERRRSSTSFKETAKKFKPTKAGRHDGTALGENASILSEYNVHVPVFWIADA
ncbi:hypothetical protein CLAFUW4_03693 [Fulvia fulva]|uniref:uncharacterized protein n=1 Tax=Passalora fulva TaxID=5499 RepID=UPI0004EA090D|nr:uncharacterized protein CLAFUR5_20161 [Fulvia fulva]KAK4631770.1 hypothetical protein CLAFUR4_03681 [Fulvia fulva]KAK4633127.1 hypothetical protein CLAFUR0_03684 [Fulvia fulva]WMI38801.1 hypothetical protein CLAFUR5_20161 [Fulvia fulva]WPV11600.1 hypothetical protein CLAFUW4_03693 [Fulvia fulva]WPV26060.1 hypothetical protein CLAFUW7_03685 [Fulvia fulva]